MTLQGADGDLEEELKREAEEAVREEREAKELLLREAKEEVDRLKRQVRNGRRVCHKVEMFNVFLLYPSGISQSLKV